MKKPALHPCAVLLGALVWGSYPQLSAASSSGACKELLVGAERLACYDRTYGAPTSAVPEEDLSRLQLLMQRREELAHDRFALTPHRPNYILPATYNADADFEVYSQLPVTDDQLDDLKDYEIKFQLSVRALLWPEVFGSTGNLSLGYTQQSYWQVYADYISAPFRETNHEPELLLEFPMHTELLGFQLRSLMVGINHQSNGRSDPLSRSWNRVVASAVLERGNFATSLKPWWRIPEDDEDDDNPNIERYMGQMEFGFGYRWNEQSFAAILKNNLRSDNKSGLQLDWSFPLVRYLRGYVQLYTGYGENLIDGPNKTNRIGVGVMLTDWY